MIKYLSIKGFLVENNAKKEPISLEMWLRVTFKGVLDTIAGGINKLGIHPNTVTILGLVGNTIGAILIASGQITWGGILVLVMGPIDALDGAMARLRGEPTKFGAFVDSVTDRYSELVIYAGLLYHFLMIDDPISCMMVFFAAAGSVLVSYAKARAESLGYEAKVGILTRVERYLVLAPCLVFSIPVVAIWIIAIFANVTAVQRIMKVRKQFYDGLRNDSSKKQDHSS
jgi:CDP-diacylglycerol--glycerol-3-phosphate 3-phosphatidyltransferase